MASLLGAVVLVASGLYFFVYLWRWEWNRAVIAGLLFVAAEVGLATGLVLGRLRRLGAAAAPEVVARIRETAPPPRDHFEWLKPKGEMGVFVPVLIGVGAVASALAWAVERVARITAGPVLEQGLPGRMAPLSWPAAGLAGRPERDADPLALLTGPIPPER